MTVTTGQINKREAAHTPFSNSTKTDSTGWAPTRMATDTWESGCTCPNNAGKGACVILDPFFGTGTVGLVALKHHRDSIGIELNADYIELARKRMEVVQPVLWSNV